MKPYNVTIQVAGSNRVYIHEYDSMEEAQQIEKFAIALTNARLPPKCQGTLISIEEIDEWPEVLDDN